MSNIIGSDLQPWAQAQVKLRQRLYGKSLFGLDSNGLNQGEIQQYLNGKTAWLRAASSAFITPQKSVELTGTDIYNGRELAKQYVLFNGTTGISRDIDLDRYSPTFGEDADSFTPTFRAGVANGISPINDFAYGLGGVEQGLVPMPGLTSLSIQTYNRGSLRKASLKLVCHNRNQFQIIDSLYMRPGFTILIEWGHTTYFTGTVDNPIYVPSPNFNTEVFFNFFKNNSLPQTDVTQNLLLANIRQERRNTGGNYDGFYGHITNFKWDYKENSTYEIDITAVSVGDVIESLNINRVKTKDNYTVPLEQRSPIAAPPTATATTNPNLIELSGYHPAQGDFTISVNKNAASTKNYKEYYIQYLGIDEGVVNRLQSFASGATGKVVAWDEIIWENVIDMVENPSLFVADGFRSRGKIRVQTDMGSMEMEDLVTKYTLHPDQKAGYLTLYNKLLSNKGNWQPLPPPTDVIKAEEINDKISTLSDENRSKFNGFLYKIYDYATTNLKRKSKKQKSNTNDNSLVNCFSGPIPPESGESFANDPFDVVAVQTFVVLDKIGGVSGNVIGHTTRASKNYPFVYIKLGRIFEYIERNLLIYNTDENDTSNGESIVNIDVDVNNNFCFTFPFQYSINPYVCVIPFSTANIDYTPSKDKNEGNVTVNKIDFNQTTEYWSNVLGDDFRKNKSYSDFVGSLMDIHVNIHFITDLIKKLTTDNSLPLLKFLESMMSGIQEALGSVNKFTVTYDHDENTVRITDDIPLDPEITGVTRETLTTFNVLGFQESTQEGAFVTDVKLSTTITNNLASMIAISAQTKKASDVVNSTGLMKFNEGIQDAIYPQKVSVVAAEQKTLSPEQIMYKTYYNLVKLRGSVVDSFYKTATACSTELVDSQQTLASSFFRYKASDYGATGTVVTQTFFPFSLGLDMDGFSGARIYERFTINNQVLPPSYPKISFVIKGLNHKVDTNGWSTDIDSLAYEALEDTEINSSAFETAKVKIKAQEEVILTSPKSTTPLQ